MQQLTGMDASFLALQTANTTRPVGGLGVPAPRTPFQPPTPAPLTHVKAGPPQPSVPMAPLPARPPLGRAWRRVQTAGITNELVGLLPTLPPPVNTLIGEILGLTRGDGAVIAPRPGRAPATPFNQAITPHRRFAFRSVDLETVKAVKNTFGVSVNDVVMAMCAGALRRWLIDHDALPGQPLVRLIPVSLRDPASQGALGNS